MSVVKRFNELLDLDEIDVLIDEVDKSRHIILSDIPDSLPQGRSSFLIETSPYMKQDTEIQIDFIDSEGSSIYTEPIADYLEGRARRVSVEVYDDTAPGIATLIIVGELVAIPDGNTIFADAEQVPQRFQGAYNVRLTKQIVINPTAVNTQPIKFFGQPIINVTETRVGTMVRTEVTGSVSTSFFELEAVPTDEDLLFKPYGVNLNPSQGLLSEGAPSSPAKQRSLKAYIESRKRKSRKGKRKNSIFKRSGLLSKTNSPPTFPYRIRPGSFNGEESFRFNTGYVGGEVHFHTSSLGNTFGSSSFYPQAALTEAGLLETPTFDTEKQQGIVNTSASMYTASIVDLVSDRIIAVDKPFTNKNVNGEDIILPIFAKGQIHYEAMPTASYAAANLVSYANVTLADMRTFSGDVYKVKVYVKSEGGFDDYKLLAEVPLEGKELLVDDASVGQGDRTGYFIAQSDVDNFWTVSGSVNGETPLGTPATNAAYNNDIMLDSVKLSGSLANPTDHLKFQLNDAYKFELIKGVDYNLSIDVIGNRSGSNYATLAFYISGSSMNQLDNLFYDEYADTEVVESSKYGKRLGTLTIKPEDDEVKDFQTVAQTFTPDVTGDGVLQIRVLKGVWNIADIAIGPAADTGFNPSLFQFKQEMPAELSHKRPDTFEFMAEFYDVNNNLSDTIAYKSGVQFTGTNMTITGEDNVLESNMFIGGDTTASGMHLGGVTSTLPETGTSGAAGSGFMRSVGYTGFISASRFGTGATEGVGKPGFMIYSGSVLPDSGDNYLGVGLELVGESGSLKFRTNPSIFEVKADTFFVGRKHENSATGVGQFMSGSEGNIEISSSLFHLDPINDRLIIGAGTTINADLSVDQLFTPAQIGGSQSNITNASSSITADGFAKFVSASIAGFTVNPIAIHSDSNSLVMSASGQITGSDVLFTGGKIAAFSLSDDAFSTNNFFISASATGNDFFISSSNFQVTAEGDLSGSQVTFTGGDIAGWTISENTLQGGNLILGKEGFIKSSDYISDISGFIITAAENGYAEFENVKIRGTMATTTFEKESVNAVGGQLFVANSAALSGSNVASTEVSMSLVNVTGFTKGEILLIKKVSDTGFNTEYVQVVSSSRNNDGGDDDPDGLAGKLFLKRGYGFYTRGTNAFHIDTNAANIKYYNTTAGTDPPSGTVIPGLDPGQNTKVDTDFLRFGSDFASGNDAGQNMVGSHVHSGSFHINITGNVTRRSDDTNSFFAIGLYDGSNSDAFIGAKRFWNYSDGAGSFEKDVYIPSSQVTGSTVRVAVLALNTDTDATDFNAPIGLKASLDYGSIGSVQLGDSGSVGDPIGEPQDYTDGQVVVSTGRYISGTGNNTVGTGYIRLNANPKNSATPYMDIVERTGSGIYDVELKARLGDLSGVAGTRNVPEGFNGFGLMSEVAFLSGSNIKLEAPTFLLGDLNQNFVSGSSGNIEISSSAFHLDTQNNVMNMSGSITASKALIGTPAGPRVSFDGTNIVMSSSVFNLGSSTNFVSGSNGNIEIKSENFHLAATGDVTMSGDLSAEVGSFLGVNVIGSLVPNSNAVGTNDGHKVVETWINETTIIGAGATHALSSTLDQLSNSSWGWTTSYSGGAESGVDIKFSDGSGTGTPSVAQMLLTPNDNRSDAAADPPQAFFKSVGQAEGRLKGLPNTRQSKFLYDANVYKNNYGNSFGAYGGVPKMGVDMGEITNGGAGAGAGETVTLTSAAINIPLTQSDIFECFLEFAIRDAGDYGGFFNISQLKILKASDDSVLYGDARKHNGTGNWIIWSVPMVAKAGLVTSAGTAVQGDAFTLITSIKIQLKVGGFTSNVMSTYQGGAAELSANHNGGGGTMDGFIITEMRMRRAPYVAALETENIVISDIYPRRPGSIVTTRNVHKAVTRFQAPMFRGSDSDTYVDTSTSNVVKIFANNNEIINAGASGMILPSQPSFLARKSADQNNLQAGVNSDITFNVEEYDAGSDYADDGSVGTFTAPRTGKYLFYARIRMPGSGLNSSKHYTLKFVTDLRTYDTEQIPGNTTSGITLNGMIIADMDAGDTCHVQVLPQAGAGDTSDIKGDGNLKTYFGGFMLG